MAKCTLVNLVKKPNVVGNKKKRFPKHALLMYSLCHYLDFGGCGSGQLNPVGPFTGLSRKSSVLGSGFEKSRFLALDKIICASEPFDISCFVSLVAQHAFFLMEQPRLHFPYRYTTFAR